MFKNILSSKRSKGAALVFAALIAAAAFYANHSPGSNQPESSQRVFTKSFAAEIGSVRNSFTSDGYVELSTYDISFDRAGIISCVNVNEGDYIESGAQIASLKSEDYESAVKTQENSLKQAKLSYQKNKQDRQQSLQSLENSLVSARHKLDNAQSEYDLVSSVEGAYSAIEIEEKRQSLESCSLEYNIAQNKYDMERNNSVDEQLDLLSIEKARESLQKAKDELQKSIIYSPVSGRIVDIAKKAGERISEEDTFIRITSDAGLSIKTDVSEIDIASVETGMPIEIKFNALGEKTCSGTVEYVDPIASKSGNGTVSYEVSISIDSQDGEIRDGMSCTVEFIKDKIDSVLVVPKKALSKSGQGKGYSVTVVGEDGSEIKKSVQVGLTDSLYAQITDGLSKGDKVKVSIDLESNTGKNRFMGPGAMPGRP